MPPRRERRGFPREFGNGHSLALPFAFRLLVNNSKANVGGQRTENNDDIWAGRHADQRPCPRLRCGGLLYGLYLNDTHFPLLLLLTVDRLGVSAFWKGATCPEFVASMLSFFRNPFNHYSRTFRASFLALRWLISPFPYAVNIHANGRRYAIPFRVLSADVHSFQIVWMDAASLLFSSRILFFVMVVIPSREGVSGTPSTTFRVDQPWDHKKTVSSYACPV